MNRIEFVTEKLNNIWSWQMWWGNVTKLCVS